MADAITIKALQDASLDAKSLEEVVNGDDAKQVATRLGETYPSVKKAIKTMFQNGGLPADPFPTKAKMITDGASLADGDLAVVYNEVDSNGLYVKTTGDWVKSSYDPAWQAKAYTDGVKLQEEANQLVTIFGTKDAGAYPPELSSAGLSLNRDDASGFIIDALESVVYIPSNLVVLDSDGVRHRTPNQSVSWVAPIDNADYNIFLYMDKVTKVFSLFSFRAMPNKQEKEDLLLCAIINRYSERMTVSTTAPYSIDYGVSGKKTCFDRAEILPVARTDSTFADLPDYNTVSHALTIPAGTSLKYRDIVFTVATEVSVSLVDPAEKSSAMAVYWDLTKNIFVVKTYSSVLKLTEKFRYVLVAIIRDIGIISSYSGNWVGKVSLVIGCNFTINGGSSHPVNYRSASIIAAASPKDGFSNLPNYNTKTTSFEFAQDTIFSSDGDMYIVPTGGLVIPCSDVNNLSSSVIVYWNTRDNTFHVRKYNHKLTGFELGDFSRIASVRDTQITAPRTTSWQDRVGIDTTMMYTINGIHPFTGNLGAGVSSVSVQSEPMVKACAHRGFNGDYLAPENTLPAFKLAADYGFWGAETDLRLTSDGHWVLMHDATIDRTTTGTGAVADLTLDQIRSFDANSGNPKYVGVKVPTLEEYLTTCKRHNIVPYMQTYADPDDINIAPLVKAIREITGEDGAVIITSKKAHLTFLRKNMPRLALEFLVSTVTAGDIAFARDIGNCSLGCASAGVTKEAVKLAAESGVRVSMWAENITPEQYIDMNVLRVTSDYAIPPNFDKGFQKLLIKNKADWSNFTESSAFTGTVTNGAITIPPTQDVSINLGSHPLGVLIVEFYATSTSEDSEVFVYAGRDIKTGVINSLSPTHKFSYLIRNNAEADVVVTFRGVTGTLTLQDLKIKVFEV